MALIHLRPMVGKALARHLLMEEMDLVHHYFLVDMVLIPKKFRHLVQLNFQRVHLYHLLRNNQVDELLEL